MRLFIKLILCSILFLKIGLAQTFSSSASAIVNMIKPLSISSVNNTINFGEIILTGSAFVQSLDPSEGAVFRIEGHPNRSVVISYSFTSLSNAQWVSQYGGTVGSLNFIADVVHTGSNSAYLNPVSVSNGGSYQLVNSGGVGLLHIWVGGSIHIQSNQPAGDYTGTFNIMVSY